MVALVLVCYLLWVVLGLIIAVWFVWLRGVECGLRWLWVNWVGLLGFGVLIVIWVAALNCVCILF